MMLLPLFLSVSHPDLLYFLHQVSSFRPLIPWTLLPPTIFFCPLLRHLGPDLLWPAVPFFLTSWPLIPLNSLPVAWFSPLCPLCPLSLYFTSLSLPHPSFPPSHFLPLLSFNPFARPLSPSLSTRDFLRLPPNTFCPSKTPPCQSANPLVPPIPLVLVPLFPFPFLCPQVTPSP